MENLLVLLDKIQHISPLGVFCQDTVVVQNPGMQHWLNLSLAKQRGISMNISYALPAQFLWKLTRELASDEAVPDQSPYSREVLAWRICALLATNEVCEDADFASPTAYWLVKNEQSKQEKEQEAVNAQADLKRYQLACQLADLYEQYLIFRPNWIDCWHEGGVALVKDISKRSAKDQSLFDDLTNDLPKLVLWQAKLWQLLIKQQAYNPVSLMNDAINNIADKKHLLPKRLSFFGLNAMAPMWLDFINALSEHIDVHFFHLNPCYAYWGDIVSEKQAIKAISQWVDGHDDISQTVGNPLLANLGQQGREFLALLQNYSVVNIEAFEALTTTEENKESKQANSVLAHIQQDILTLSDARQAPITLKDDSITITSAHSALREVQGLHDWLLHQFNDDPSLTPKDILVMCPQIENYAPYVSAVFTRGWQDLSDDIPPLPCSIADRASLNAEPIVAAFSELLTLPDSRFQVSQLVGLLRLEAMQLKFDLSLEELSKIILWLDQATVHWGLDDEHKQTILKSPEANNNFTWQQGLSRLLRGFAFGDTDSYDSSGNSHVIFQNQLLISSVEGGEALLLGKLMLILEQLQFFAAQLATPRSANNWQSYLMNMVDELFDIQTDQAFSLINQALVSLVEYCHHAKFTDKISLLIVRDFLNNHFSQPDPGRQFMIGQVTFCSMLPMRSIPFKVIAILGLNDGEFPRQRQPLGFDLMEVTPPKLGDRSRRGDDRYLFLEAIISARKALYLSYQGRNIKNNSEKQASLVLKELMEYLELGFGWDFSLDKSFDKTLDNASDLRQLPMQAFSDKNYHGKYKGFDDKWLTLKNPLADISCVIANNDSGQNNDLLISAEEAIGNSDNLNISLDQMVRFYQHPVKAFAQQQLNLYFAQNEITLEDSEPFASDRLQSYLLRQQLLDACLTSISASSTLENDKEAVLAKKLDTVKLAAKLSGKFPDLPSTEQTFIGWQEDSIAFAEQITIQQADNPEFIDIQLSLETTNKQKITVQTKLPIKADKVVFYRSSSAKAKDLFTLYLHQLFVQVYQDQMLDVNSVEQSALSKLTATTGLYFDTKSQKVTQYLFADLAEAKSKLLNLIKLFFLGQQQALLLNGDIAQQMFKRDRKGNFIAFEQSNFDKLWQDPNAMFALGDDPYMHYFWPQCPELSEHQGLLEDVYQNMYQDLTLVKEENK
jgi:exodeoxyribonuclease V gamma subunit